MSDEHPRLGFGLPVSGRWATPETMLRVARRAEELGYASLWTFQRVLSTDEHQSVLDSIAALAFVAGHTERIRLGTATICAPFTLSSTRRRPTLPAINRASRSNTSWHFAIRISA